MKILSRIVLGIAVLSLAATFYLPVWRIDLNAPQYPEGLVMKIWLNKISGDVDVINGLNHYIGMKHIKVEMFPEFKFLVYITAFYILFGLLTALLGNRKLLTVYFLMMVTGATLALWDFYRWGYDYGHNLDPNAAIQVPGLSYQPPVVGFKQLLNFGAWSLPDAGGWIFIFTGVTTFFLLAYEWMMARKAKKLQKETNRIHSKTAGMFAFLMSFSLSFCTPRPEAIQFGNEGCQFCKMTIMDKRFGGEIITQKGKVFKFDDLNCLVNFRELNQFNKKDLAFTLVIDFSQPGKLIDTQQAIYVFSPELRSPMAANIAAFEKQADAKNFIKNKTEASLHPWTEILDKIRKKGKEKTENLAVH